MCVDLKVMKLNLYHVYINTDMLRVKHHTVLNFTPIFFKVYLNSTSIRKGRKYCREP